MSDVPEGLRNVVRLHHLIYWKTVQHSAFFAVDDAIENDMGNVDRLRLIGPGE